MLRISQSKVWICISIFCVTRHWITLSSMGCAPAEGLGVCGTGSGQQYIQISISLGAGCGYFHVFCTKESWRLRHTQQNIWHSGATEINGRSLHSLTRSVGAVRKLLAPTLCCCCCVLILEWCEWLGIVFHANAFNCLLIRLRLATEQTYKSISARPIIVQAARCTHWINQTAQNICSSFPSAIIYSASSAISYALLFCVYWMGLYGCAAALMAQIVAAAHFVFHI